MEELGSSVTGEGIETPAQFHTLQALGCDRGQGYVFARPQPPADVVDLVAAGAVHLPR